MGHSTTYTLRHFCLFFLFGFVSFGIYLILLLSLFEGGGGKDRGEGRGR